MLHGKKWGGIVETSTLQSQLFTQLSRVIYIIIIKLLIFNSTRRPIKHKFPTRHPTNLQHYQRSIVQLYFSSAACYGGSDSIQLYKCRVNKYRSFSADCAYEIAIIVTQTLEPGDKDVCDQDQRRSSGKFKKSLSLDKGPDGAISQLVHLS